MKEKIVKLIKEVGINEVESILNQMKSKVNVREELKKDFVELLTGCTISFDYNHIEYNKNGSWLFYYRNTDNVFGVRKKIWLDFDSNIRDQELLKELLTDIVEDVLNYKGVTPVLLFV